jgi:hypothetical protein
MRRPFDVHLPLEPAYRREAGFALELLDAVTLARVSDGVTVKAEGIAGKPVRNAGGLFVWLQQDFAPLRRVTIDPGRLPYETVERVRADLRLPPATPALTTVELPPRADYAFAPGITGLRGTLLEEPITSPRPRVPVAGAEIHLRWLDEDGVTWRDAPTRSHTDEDGGFVSILRLTAADVPRVDSGQVTVRVRARRGAVERGSAELKLPQGRVADPSTLAPGPGAQPFAWDDLQP